MKRLDGPGQAEMALKNRGAGQHVRDTVPKPTAAVLATWRQVRLTKHVWMRQKKRAIQRGDQAVVPAGEWLSAEIYQAAASYTTRETTGFCLCLWDDPASAISVALEEGTWHLWIGFAHEDTANHQPPLPACAIAWCLSGKIIAVAPAGHSMRSMRGPLQGPAVNNRIAIGAIVAARVWDETICLFLPPWSCSDQLSRLVSHQHGRHRHCCLPAPRRSHWGCDDCLVRHQPQGERGALYHTITVPSSIGLPTASFSWIWRPLGASRHGGSQGAWQPWLHSLAQDLAQRRATRQTQTWPRGWLEPQGRYSPAPRPWCQLSPFLSDLQWRLLLYREGRRVDGRNICHLRHRGWRIADSHRMDYCGWRIPPRQRSHYHQSHPRTPIPARHSAFRPAFGSFQGQSRQVPRGQRHGRHRRALRWRPHPAADPGPVCSSREWRLLPKEGNRPGGFCGRLSYVEC